MFAVVLYLFSFLFIAVEAAASDLRPYFVETGVFDFANVFTDFLKQIYPSNLVNITSFDTYKHIHHKQLR